MRYRFGIIRRKVSVNYTGPPGIALTFIPFKQPSKARSEGKIKLVLPTSPILLAPPPKSPYFIGLGMQLSGKTIKNNDNKFPHEFQKFANITHELVTSNRYIPVLLSIKQLLASFIVWVKTQLRLS